MGRCRHELVAEFADNIVAEFKTAEQLAADAAFALGTDQPASLDICNVIADADAAVGSYPLRKALVRLDTDSEAATVGIDVAAAVLLPLGVKINDTRGLFSAADHDLTAAGKLDRAAIMASRCVGRQEAADLERNRILRLPFHHRIRLRIGRDAAN